MSPRSALQGLLKVTFKTQGRWNEWWPKMQQHPQSSSKVYQKIVDLLLIFFPTAPGLCIKDWFSFLCFQYVFSNFGWESPWKIRRIWSKILFQSVNRDLRHKFLGHLTFLYSDHFLSCCAIWVFLKQTLQGRREQMSCIGFASPFLSPSTGAEHMASQKSVYMGPVGWFNK